MSCQKSARRCGAKHISKSKCNKTHHGSEHLWKLRCRNSARRCGAKHISKSKCARHDHASKHFCKLKCRKSAHRFGVKHIYKSKVLKIERLGPLLKVQMWFAWQEQGIVHLVKNEKFCRISKNDGRRGTFGEDLQRCISRGRRSTRDMFIRDVGTVRRSGR